MDELTKKMEEYEQKKEMEYQEFMKTCHDKITSGELIYRAMALFIARRFEVKISSYRGCDVDGSVYYILNHYINEIDEDFETWLNKEDAPLIRSRKQLRRIFPEFKFIKSDRELVETANKVYNLNLQLTEDYIYSLSFDFNSFTPINVEEIHEIKEEIKVLKKYGHPTDELEEKLSQFNLSSEIMEVI